MGNLALDFFSCPRLLLDGVDIDIKLYPQRDEFILLANKDDYALEIVDVSFKACLKSINTGILAAHAQTLKTSPALYPYRRADMKIFTISAGSQNFVQDNIWGDNVPRSVLITLTGSAAYGGHIRRNPFGFYDKHLSYICLTANNEASPAPLHLDFDSKNYAPAYYTLRNRKHQISYSAYAAGYTIYELETKAGNGEQDYALKPTKGNTRLEMRFNIALAESTVVIIYALYDQIISIDGSRVVSSHAY